MARNNERPDPNAVARMLQRMHNDAAQDCSRAGWHASSAQHEQLAAKYRNVAAGE